MGCAVTFQSAQRPPSSPSAPKNASPSPPQNLLVQIARRINYVCVRALFRLAPPCSPPYDTERGYTVRERVAPSPPPNRSAPAAPSTACTHRHQPTAISHQMIIRQASGDRQAVPGR